MQLALGDPNFLATPLLPNHLDPIPAGKRRISHQTSTRSIPPSPIDHRPLPPEEFRQIFWTLMDLFGGSRMCQVEEGLFLGSFSDACVKDNLKSLNITHVLTVANLKPPYPGDFVYKVIDVMDVSDARIMLHFEECIDFINNAKAAGGNILVHCFMGISRSVTVVVAYLMKQRGMRLPQALEHVKRRRPQAAPNNGFILQLEDFERSLYR
ncbi:hypothetical protein MLD38_012022 [Melastoma candidum]|uniref:Uncharacterized protein n=1 Tax=Melastoma candidum TaxID=119954 RepID=A0ACB9R699_9MYRT|nr:hypothetical protein MLD38_012022 [Melastoma candidum]